MYPQKQLHYNYSNEHNDFKLTFIVRRRQSVRVCSGEREQTCTDTIMTQSEHSPDIL